MALGECIHEKRKIAHVKWGDARVFGEDSDIRKTLSDEECIKRFSDLWASKLAKEVEDAPEISREEAEELLEENEHFRRYAVAGYEFRQFSLFNVPFVARITTGGICDQLWALGAHRDNTRLCMYFSTIPDRKRFEGIAQRLGWVPRDLALRLVTDFMQKVDRQYVIGDRPPQ